MAIINKNVKKSIQIALVVAVMAIVVCLFPALVLSGIEKADRERCEELRGQAEMYPLWYATEGERAMCSELGAALPADNAAMPN